VRRTVAAIDCGTNTIKLLIGDMPDVVVREMRVVRLGQGVDRTGKLADEALARTFAAIEEYAATIREHGAERIRFVATSAVRDASNADVFMAGVRERLGIEPEVVTGMAEAALSYDGAVRNLREQPALPVLVVDVGGGSTELILGDAPGAPPQKAVSMDIGSVRLHERYLRTDPPTTAELAACADAIDDHLDASPVSPGEAATLVAVGGTATQLAAGVIELAAYDLGTVTQVRLAAREVPGLVDRLVSMTVAERRALHWMHPGRADVIAAGGLILSRILQRSGVEQLLVAQSDILDGIAWSITD
jgi:exopolyphosphatase/guanosine-5'-triphosphate,3'-diphosphate pyrophosphatase